MYMQIQADMCIAVLRHGCTYPCNVHVWLDCNYNHYVSLEWISVKMNSVYQEALIAFSFMYLWTIVYTLRCCISLHTVYLQVIWTSTNEKTTLHDYLAYCIFLFVQPDVDVAKWTISILNIYQVNTGRINTASTVCLKLPNGCLMTLFFAVYSARFFSRRWCQQNN